MRATTSPKENLERLYWTFLVAGMALLCAWPCIDGDFIRDDRLYVLANPHVVAAAPLAEVFSAPFAPDQELGLWRPLTTLSFRCDLIVAHTLGRELPDPRTAHVTNMLLAALATVLLVRLALQLGFSSKAALFAGLFFAVAAARSEAVCWISGRAENLMCAATLGALVAAGLAGWRRTLLVASATALAVMSKEQGLLVPLLLALLPGSARERWQRAWPAIVVASALLLLRWNVLGVFGPEGLQQVLRGSTLLERLHYGLEALGRYTQITLLPWPLSNEYDAPDGSIHWRALLWCAATIVVLLAAMRNSQRSLFAAALWIVPLVPVLNIFVRSGEVFAERFLALPLAGAALLLAPPMARPRWWLLPLALLIALNVPLAMRQARAWRSETELVRTMQQAEVQDAGALRLSAYLQRGEYVALQALGTADPSAADELAKRYRAVLEHAPHDVETALDLAKHLKAMALTAGLDATTAQTLRSEAETHVRALLALEMDNAHAHAVLGEILAEQQRLEESLAAFRRSRELDLRDSNAALWMAKLLRGLKRETEARMELAVAQAALAEMKERRPWDAQPCFALARVCVAQDDGAGACAALEEARSRARTAPLQAQAALEHAELLRAMKRPEEAMTVLREVATLLEDAELADEIAPRSDRYAALTQLELASGRRDAALHWLDKNLNIAPTPRAQHGLTLLRQRILAPQPR
ncbi:MAG: hypothetical protein EXS14_03765 [Planctomycetes bacterium]|nr:hypothetical protein [Planctomycetota bacterium]